MQQIALPRPEYAFRASPTLVLCIAGLLLPNLVSMAALVAGIGYPQRTAAIVLYAIVAVLARYVPRKFVFAAFIFVAIYDAVCTIALQFGLATTEIGLALHLVDELDLLESPLYLVMIAGCISVALASVMIMMRYRHVLRAANPNIFLGAVLFYCAVDFIANTSAHYQFGSIYGANKPMESAAETSGFRQLVLAHDPKRVLVIVVEAMGKFSNPALQETLLTPFASDSLQKKYRVTNGSSTYFGSTTAGEMRELCDTRANYKNVAAEGGIGCLPGIFKDRGYKTAALHNFTKKFFDRRQWWPKIGFQETVFKEDLKRQNMRQCGGPFRGPCDVEMFPRITRAFQETEGPLFYYWLTLSTHVPIMPREATPRLGCDNQGGAFGQTEVCNMAEMWIDIFEGVVKMTEAIGPTEILIVGDHGPPLWSRIGRNLFEPGQVTWIRLSPRVAE